jgi:hypothetical protein
MKTTAQRLYATLGATAVSMLAVPLTYASEASDAAFAEMQTEAEGMIAKAWIVAGLVVAAGVAIKLFKKFSNKST